MLPRSAAIPLLFAGLCGVGQVCAQLPARSPFVYPEAAVEAARREQVLEFDGFVGTPAGMEFIVLDKARKARAWLRLNQRNSDFDLVAKKYDPENATLTVERGGGVEVLPMRRPKIISGGAPVPYRPVSLAPPSPTPAAPPAPVASAQALEQVVADVQARRAAREQAAIQAAGTQATGQSPAGQR